MIFLIGFCLQLLPFDTILLQLQIGGNYKPCLLTSVQNSLRKWERMYLIWKNLFWLEEPRRMYAYLREWLLLCWKNAWAKIFWGNVCWFEFFCYHCLERPSCGFSFFLWVFLHFLRICVSNFSALEGFKRPGSICQCSQKVTAIALLCVQRSICWCIVCLEMFGSSGRFFLCCVEDS